MLSGRVDIGVVEWAAASPVTRGPGAARSRHVLSQAGSEWDTGETCVIGLFACSCSMHKRRGVGGVCMCVWVGNRRQPSPTLDASLGGGGGHGVIGGQYQQTLVEHAFLWFFSLLV